MNGDIGSSSCMMRRLPSFVALAVLTSLPFSSYFGNYWGSFIDSFNEVYDLFIGLRALNFLVIFDKTCVFRCLMLVSDPIIKLFSSLLGSKIKELVFFFSIGSSVLLFFKLTRS